MLTFAPDLDTPRVTMRKYKQKLIAGSFLTLLAAATLPGCGDCDENGREMEDCVSAPSGACPSRPAALQLFNEMSTASSYPREYEYVSVMSDGDRDADLCCYVVCVRDFDCSFHLPAGM